MKLSGIVALGDSVLVLLALSLLPVSAAAGIDEHQLPPPADQEIDFRRDIEPILKEHCLKCHGPERPKSNFRLTSRDHALKGGNNGIAVIAGQSAQSPLIHYVARLVPDLEMPPEGKGTPLSKQQVSLLRAWIDQGVPWEAAPASQAGPSLSAVPFVGGITVHGDEGRFREVEAQPEGWNGGLERFRYSVQEPEGTTTVVEGHLFRDDYELTLDWRAPDAGFARFGFDRFRTYYDDAGGFYEAFDPSLYRLGRDLFLDLTRAWTEIGLTLPNWPTFLLGYELVTREGDKSALNWGPVWPPSGDYLNIRNIYPSSKTIDDTTHIVRFDIVYDQPGLRLENRLRLDFHDSTIRRTDALNVPAGAAGPDLLVQVDQQTRTTQVTDSVAVHKELTGWWLAALGYRYSWLDSDTALRLSPQDGGGNPAAGSAWWSDKIVLDEVWQVLNANTQFRPLPNLTATVGVQAQWKRQDSFGDVNLDEVLDPNDPTSGTFRFPATERSTLDLTGVEETVLVRYGGLPFTSLYAEARLEQEDYSRYAAQAGGSHDVLFDSDATVGSQDYRVGFNTAPWSRLSLGGYYRYRERQTDYDYPLAQRVGAYPGFILERDIDAHEVDARATYRPLRWLKATLEYRYSIGDYRTTTGATSPDIAGPDATPGGSLLAGRYEAHTVNASATFTLSPKLYLSVAGAYQHSETTTADHSSLAVAPYRGELWSVLPTVTWILDEKTDLSLSYAFSRARYGQDNAESGLPLGIDYDRHGVRVGLSRRFSRSVSAQLRYGYFSYEEPTSGSLRDYNAHQVLLVTHLVW